ncbi:MAG: TatD family hydrolase [Bacteriovoracaceae bacterium]|nr:TatD family hydrolase [Bacteriovoracaceae bacterium]
MNQLPYLDIHTHRRGSTTDSVSVACLSVDELIQGQLFKDHSCAGIHPWWTEDYTQEEISAFKERILKLAQDQRLWAIGETGIDRAYPEFLDLQRELFFWHLDLAENYQLPLVIHSVRSGSDFLQIIKERKPTTAWIFHDFRGNENLMRDLLRLHPQSYFSFGMSIDNSPQVRELLPLVPLQNLFLETDDQKHLDIHDIYVRAENILKIDMDLLKSQIWLNFKKVSHTSQN